MPSVLIFLHCEVGDSGRNDRLPSEDLKEECRQVWQLSLIADSGEAVASDHGVELGLCESLGFREQDHRGDEHVERGKHLQNMSRTSESYLYLGSLVRVPYQPQLCSPLISNFLIS